MTLSEIVRQNFQAARELVARQANRHARTHLLVAMDEVLRQADEIAKALDARQAPAEPPPDLQETIAGLELEMAGQSSLRKAVLVPRELLDRALSLLRQRLAAPVARPAGARDVTATVSEIRGGEDNDGPLESTDLWVRGRGISLLCNVMAGQQFTYSLVVDDARQSAAYVGALEPASPPADTAALRDRLTEAVYRDAERAWDTAYAAALRTSGPSVSTTRALTIAHDAWRSVIVRAITAGASPEDQ